MSIWINSPDRPDVLAPAAARPNRRHDRFIPVILLTVLAACAGVNEAAVTRIAVLDGAVTLAAPRGYCVDNSALLESSRGAFALFGSCAALAPGLFAPAPTPLAVLSATVSTPRSGNALPIAQAAEGMAAYFASPAGRRALSRGRDADTVRILRTGVEDGVFFMRLRDTSTMAGPRVAPEYWRAVFDVNRHMVTLSVLALEGAPIDEATSERVIRDFAVRVRAANRS